MTDDEFKKATEKIKRIYRKLTGDINSPEAEDIAQEVICRRLSNPNSASQNYQQSVIDCLRQRSGRKGTCSYEQRRLIMSATTTTGRDDIGSYVGERGDSWHFERFFRGTDRAILLLIIKWGLSETEVADLFGVSESRICQRYKGIQKRIQQRIAAQKKAGSGRAKKGSGEMAKILSEETKRNGWQLVSFEDKGLATGQPW